MNRDNKRKYTEFSSIMERAVVAVDRADVYIGGSEPVRECIKLLDNATEEVRLGLEKPKRKEKAKHD